jgi:hypothetical protein
MAGKHATGYYPEDGGAGPWRYGDPDMTIPDILGLDSPEADAGGRQSDRAQGRHAAPKRPFLRRKTVRFRAGRVVPAAAIAAALAVGAAAYGVTTSVRGSSEATARLATVPSGGYTLAAGGALAAVSPGKLLGGSSGQGQSGDTSGGLTGALATGMAQSQRVLAGVAKSAAAAHAAAHPAAAKASSPSPAVTSAPSHAAPSSGTTPVVTSPPAATTAPATSAPAATSLTCNTSDGMLPDNVTAIVSFLLAHGYSDNAAAGIAGNMYQESKGNPESEGDGGGGLIGWTPLPAGYVTGNPAADLQTQLSAVLTFNEQWSQYLPQLNDAATPADAAAIYVTDFERAGIPAAGTREAAAQDVASACGI